MKIIGITGGIGSGKSTVARIFQTLSVPVFYADEVGRDLLNSDAQIMHQVSKAIGEEAYTNGVANRSWIAAQVFNSPELLQQINSIIHPAVGKAFQIWMNRIPINTAYCIREAAILFESGTNADCDAVVCVTAPEPLRIERVMKRDGVDQNAVRDRMARQMDEQEKASRSEFIISNDGIAAVIPQVLSIHQNILG